MPRKKMRTASREKQLEMLEKMLLTRRFEEKVDYYFATGLAHGTTHLYVGEEAVAAGVCCALEKQDVIVSTHRGHGHCIAMGLDPNRMMAEILGKADGYCKGKGGSMHIADIESGNLGANGIVGGGLPIAVGAALTTKMKNLDKIVVCFFGDGASNEGTFHESLNLASVWNLPVLFVCENNQYGMSTSVKKSMAIDDISIRASSYGMKGVKTNGMDAREVYTTATDARMHVQEHGPMLMVCETYRYLGHSKSDANAYRTQDEIDFWKTKDCIALLQKQMLAENLCTQDNIDALKCNTRQAVENAAVFAQNCDFPTPDEILTDIYA